MIFPGIDLIDSCVNEELKNSGWNSFLTGRNIYLTVIQAMLDTHFWGGH